MGEGELFNLLVLNKEIIQRSLTLAIIFPLAIHLALRIGVAGQALGIASASIDCAVKYALERKAFDKPIANFRKLLTK